MYAVDFVIDDFGAGSYFLLVVLGFWWMNFALASPWFSPIAPEKHTGLIILDVMDPETQFTVPCGSLAATPEHVEDTAAGR